ncbi:putative peptidase [Candidatus Calditenuaceae archaeon HR02]|nr:putative peptidase [Candidatus Calditenuaceae archaeon HR02]
MYSNRLKRLLEDIDRLGLDAVMLTFEPNMYYLSGYGAISLERLVALVLFREQDTACLIVPKLEKDRAEKNCKLQNIEILTYSDVEDPINILKGLFSKYRVKHLGVDGGTPYRFVHPIISSGSETDLSLIDETMYSLRIIKDAEEIRCLEKSADINNKLMVETIGHVRAGLSEKQLATFVRTRALELGADEVAFTLIQSGGNSALPHQEPTDRRIGKGEIVLLDIGIRFMGYFSDITRTITCGGPSQQQQQIFDIVYRAQSAALTIAKEGLKAGDLDKKARQTISEAGYGEYFIHRTGHGLGLEVHEPPYIKEDNVQELRKGMVFTVEPGIYLAGRFGVRLEDNVIITEDGHTNLTKLPKSLSIEEYL